jgi:hypothetical protein
VDGDSAKVAGFDENSRYLRAGRLIKGDVGNQACAEKSGDAMAGAIDELIGDQEFAGGEIFFERTDSADGDDSVHAKELERVDVGAIVDFARKNAMTAAVAGEECDGFPFEEAGNNGIGRIAEGRFDADFLAVIEPLHRVQTAATDDADGRSRLFGILGRRFRLGFQSCCSLSRVAVRNADYQCDGYFNISGALRGGSRIWPAVR